MTHVPLRSSRRPRLAAVGLLTLLLTACTGRGGGQLPPNGVYNGSASFGFSFTCEDKGGLNPSTGELRIQLSYTERSTGLYVSPFSIHGVADELDPVLESAICIGKNPPPGGNELIFLGRYRVTSGSEPALDACANAEKPCRFEVVVRDSDRDRVPSRGDFFEVTLSGGTTAASELNTAPVLYTRAGVLSSGNLTVD